MARLGQDAEEGAVTQNITHVVVSHSRGFAWVRTLDAETGLARWDAPILRFQCRPGVHCVVGDRVEIGGDNVVGVGARTGVLSRAVGPKRQVLATHVDRVALVMSVGRGL